MNIQEKSNVTAHVVIKKGEVRAIVQFLYTKAGVVHCQVIDKINGGLIHSGKAGGYGYDKASAALSGAVIDGVTIYDHCSLPTENDKQIMRGLVELHKRYGHEVASDAAKKHGARMANGGESAYYESGLDRLRVLGYQVIKAV